MKAFACTGKDTAIFFDPAREDEAKAICSRCSNLEPCRDEAVLQGIEYGVWGGTTGDERAKLWARQGAM